MKISKKVEKVVVPAVVDVVTEEVEIPTQVLEAGIKKYIRLSASKHFIVWINSRETSFCCKAIKTEGFPVEPIKQEPKDFTFAPRFQSNSSEERITADGEFHPRLWLLVTTNELTMLDPIPYSRNATWNDEAKLISSLDFDEDENNEEGEEE